MNTSSIPIISVIIPTYNHANYLGRALQSVLDQTYTNWEAIIIDNHSTDNTDEIMNKFDHPQITYLKINNNGVIAASRNAGIQAANGEWVAFLDSDDWWTNNKLQKCVDRIDDKVDVIYHDMEFVTDSPRWFRRKNVNSWQVKNPVLMDLLLRGNALVNSSVILRSSLLKQIGGISERVEMIASEDYNTWLRLAQLTENFIYLPRRLGYYLQHSQSISKKDMSKTSLEAVAEFRPLLSKNEHRLLDAKLRFTKARFNFSSNIYAEAQEDFLFCVNNGNLNIKMKSALFFILLMCKKYLNGS